jgi:ankyrin repeat protein
MITVNSIQSYSESIPNELDRELLRSIRIQDDIRVIDELLARRANVNACSGDDCTALSLAMKGANPSIVFRLLEEEALDVGQSNPWCDLIESELASEHKLAVAHELLFRGVDVNGRNTTGQGVLELCRLTNQKDLFKLFQDSGATDIERGRSASSPPGCSENGFDEPLSPLQRRNSSPIVCDVYDMRPVVVRLGDLFSELAGARASVVTLEASGSVRNSPINSATSDPRMTETDLIALKMELLNKLNMYLTEFERAKTGKDFLAIRSLMDVQKRIADTRVEITDISRRIADGDFAVEDGCNDDGGHPAEPVGWFRSPESVEADIEVCMRQIRKSSGTLDNIESAIFDITKRCQSYDVVPALKLLRNRGSNVNYQDPDTGSTALMKACEAGSEDLVSWLLNFSAQEGANLVDKKRGWTAVHYAVKSGNRRICESLISRFNGDKVSLVSITDKEGKVASDLSTNAAISRLLSAVSNPAQSS